MPSRLIPKPRAIRWDYRNGGHYWLTQWRAWIFSAIVLVIAVVDLADDGQPFDHDWVLWSVWFASGLVGTVLPYLTWRRWIGPLIAERNARGAEVRKQIAAIEARLADESLAPWDRRKLELTRDMCRDELELVTAPRTTLPRAS